MRVIRQHPFGEVQAWELGFAPLGQPFMTVHLYLVDGVLIDTGLGHLRQEVLALARQGRVRQVLLTHYHEDHSGNAAALQRALQVPVWGHPGTVARMRRPGPILPYRHWTWGRAEPLEVQPLTGAIRQGRILLEPLETPGHSADHLAYLEPERGWLFSGDLYLADRVKYCRREQRIGDEICSLKRVLARDFDSLFCAHRPFPQQGKARLRAKLQYLEDLQGAVATLWRQGRSVRAIMRQLQIQEQWAVRLACFDDVSARNLVRAVVSSLPSA